MREPVKERTVRHWAANPIGTKTAGFGSGHEEFTKEYFEDHARFRYVTYAPWLPTVADFWKYKGRRVLDVGCGMGTDLLEFARGGAIASGLDMTPRHIELAKRRFQLFGMKGRFVVGDAENLPFQDDTFDFIYSNGVLHHTPNTQRAVNEVHRALRSGGEALIILYHKHSFVYWLNICLNRGLRELLRCLLRGDLSAFSFQRLLSESTDGPGNPLSKVFTRREGLAMCRKFARATAEVYHLNSQDFPSGHLVPRCVLQRLSKWVGWYVVLRAAKDGRG